MYDLARNRFTPLALRGNVFGGVWTPYGRRIIAALDANLLSVAATALARRKRLSPPQCRTFLISRRTAIPLVFASASVGETGLDLWTASLKTHVAKPCVATRFAEDHPRYSPNGRWLAYESNDTGVLEVYIRPANCGGAKAQVSNGGGQSPKVAEQQGCEFYTENHPTLQVAGTESLREWRAVWDEFRNYVISAA